MSPPRIGVIGTGWWATTAHLPALRDYPSAELAAIADPNAANLEAAGSHFGVERRFPDYREMLDAGRLDGVVIAVPHTFHYEIARDALDAGLHVLLEKPMTLRASEAWDLVERARGRGLQLVIGYESHFTRHAVAARDLVQSGRIGELRFVSGLLSSMAESWYRGAAEDYGSVFDFTIAKPQEGTYSDERIAGGGQGQTQVTHALGLIFWTTGLRATEVSAFVDGFGIAVDLVDAMSFRLDNTAVGTMGSTGSLRPNQPWQIDFRYYGTEGFLLHDTVRGQLAAYFNDGSSELFAPLEPDEISPPGAPARCLVDLILGQGENLAPGDAGAKAVEFLEAAYLSAAEGRVVKVDELA
jgi:predicted dehydrogenase